MGEIHLLSPAGFRAGAAYAGIKSKRTPDVGLLVCDGDSTSAVAFTTNEVFAAPIAVGREHASSGRLRAVVVNSGNANACTGPQGIRDAREMCRVAAQHLSCAPRLVLPSSTGIIGHHLPMAKVRRGIAGAARDMGCSREHALRFGDAILTTDTRRKTAGTRVRIGKSVVTVAGTCKGAGMIGPRLAVPQATLLSYVTTDALLSASVLRKLLAACVDQSFNCVTIDDHTSTNDTCCVLASGQSGGRVNSIRAARTLLDAMTDVCQSLARQIAADGEGASKMVTVQVRQAASPHDARLIARAIANSPLVKCAMNGNDPNWGRVVSAAGMCGARFDPDRASLSLQGTCVFRRGRPARFDADRVSRALAAREVVLQLDCGLRDSSATVWTCDLSKQYVSINADYHT